MNIHARFRAAIERIATWTSVARTRTEDAARAENHMGLVENVEAAVVRLEQIADELDKALLWTDPAWQGSPNRAEAGSDAARHGEARLP
jgi:tetrahydromethanopterin S-methyltransferase subunit B